MPNLLVAPSRAAELLAEDQNSQWGWYADGAYTAASHVNGTRSSPLASPADADSDVDAQEAYYAALLARFSALRRALARSPPPSANAAAQASDATIGNATQLAARQGAWSYVLRRVPPTARYLASLQQEDVIRGLGRLETLLARRTLMEEEGDGGVLGAWCWGLLGKCRDVGEMGSEEVAVLRELGKKALWVGRKMRLRIMEPRGNAPVDDDVEDREIEDEIVGEMEQDIVEEENGRSKQEVEDEGEFYETAGDKLGVPDTQEAPEKSPETDRTDANESGDPVEADGRVESAFVPRKALSADESAELERMKRRLLSRVGSARAREAPRRDEATADGDVEGKAGATEGAADVAGGAAEGSPGCSEGAERGAAFRRESEEERERRAFATLDIVVTIVGEVFGQRDLLDAREVWGEFD